MLASPTKNESASQERLRDFISSDVIRKERLRTENSELIVKEESKQRHSSAGGDLAKNAPINGNGSDD